MLPFVAAPLVAAMSLLAPAPVIPLSDAEPSADPCAGVVALIAGLSYTGPAGTEALVPPACAAAARQGDAPAVEAALRRLITPPGLRAHDTDAVTLAAYTSTGLVCALASPGVARQIGALARDAHGEHRAPCLGALAELQTPTAQALTNTWLELNAFYPKGDGLEVSSTLVEAVARSPRLRARVGPVLRKAIDEAAWGVEKLHAAVCPARPHDDPTIVSACRRSHDEMARLPPRRLRLRRLGQVGLTLALTGGIVGTTAALRDQPVGRGIAIGTTTVGGVVAGGWLLTILVEGGNDWGAGLAEGLAALAGGLGGGVAGGLFGAWTSQDPGSDRVATAAAGVAPLLLLTAISIFERWSQP